MDDVTWSAMEPTKQFWMKFSNVKGGYGLEFDAMEAARSKKIDFWNDEVSPERPQFDKPVTSIHAVIAERRSVLLDSQQLFT